MSKQEEIKQALELSKLGHWHKAEFDANAPEYIKWLHDENQSLRRSLTSEAVKNAKYNAEIMRLRKELEEAQKPTANLERVLLEMWHSQGIKEIYKYKHRIKIYRREGLEGYDLFNDITCGLLFREVEDTANYRDATPEDFKVSVDFLLGQEGEGNHEPN